MGGTDRKQRRAGAKVGYSSAPKWGRRLFDGSHLRERLPDSFPSVFPLTPQIYGLPAAEAWLRAVVPLPASANPPHTSSPPPPPPRPSSPTPLGGF